MKKFWNFIKDIWGELKARWNDTSPHLFKLIRKVAVGVAFIAGAFSAIKLTGVTLPDALNILTDRAIVAGAIATYLVAKLPVDMDKAKQSTINKIEDNKPE